MVFGDAPTAFVGRCAHVAFHTVHSEKCVAFRAQQPRQTPLLQSGGGCTSAYRGNSGRAGICKQPLWNATLRPMVAYYAYLGSGLA